MPWDCNVCGTHILEDVSGCPECGAHKTTWTVIRDMTRTMIVPRMSFLLKKGDCGRAYTPDHELQQGIELTPADAAVAMPAAVLRAIHERGELPPSANVLFVELHAGNKTTVQVTCEVLFDTKPSVEHEFEEAVPAGLPQGTPTYAHVIFVYGEGDLSGVSFEDVHLVDLSEDTESGYAPFVEVAALGRPALELPVTLEPTKEYAFSG